MDDFLKSIAKSFETFADSIYRIADAAERAAFWYSDDVKTKKELVEILREYKGGKDNGDTSISDRP